MKPYYADDHVTLYHARWEDVPPDLLRADVLVTDPPYGIDFAGQPTKWQRLAGHRPEDWDKQAPDVAPLLTMTTAQCIWGGNYFPLPVTRGWLAWVKPDAPPSMGSVELAWTSLDQNARFISWSIGATNAERVGHPTQKPLTVMRWTLGHMPDGTILDPYAGSGTTLVAAKSLNRKAIGVECVERYCEVAAKRLSQEVLGLVA